MILDCFPYYNEKELMELRIRMLSPYVDEFIICEGNFSFSGEPKEFTCKSEIDKLGLSEKITVIEFDMSHLKNIKNPWVREASQRNAAIKYLRTFDDDDVIIATDCDEIIFPEKLHYYHKILKSNKDFYVKIPMIPLYARADMVACFSTGQLRCWHDRPFLCFSKHLKRSNIHSMRENANNPFMNKIIYDSPDNGFSGWHFGWMGGTKNILNKIQSFSHCNDEFPDSEIKKLGTSHAINYVKNYKPVDGGFDPLGRHEYVLKRISHDILPTEIFKHGHIRNFLLPDS